MSTDGNENTERIVVPSDNDTRKQIDAIGEHHVGHAEIALKELAHRMWAVLNELDRVYNIAEYINAVTIEPLGDGHFKLVIDDKYDAVDHEALRAELEKVQAEMGGFGKPERFIQLAGEENHG